MDLAALPEVWPRQGSAPQMREAAEPLDGPHVTRLAEVARRHRLWVHRGVLELDGDRVFNTSVLFDRSGELVATYRKIHLFDADPPVRYRAESRPCSHPGDQVVTAETEFGRVGLSICYDVRFPELYRALVVQGATIMFVPAAFRYETGIDHWEPCSERGDRGPGVRDRRRPMGDLGTSRAGAEELRAQPGRRSLGARPRRGPGRPRRDHRRAGSREVQRTREILHCAQAPSPSAVLLTPPVRQADARRVVLPG